MSASSHSSGETAAKIAAKEPFLTTMRELVRAYQAFDLHSQRHIRELGLTPPQFDVIATLGNTAGMSMGEVAKKTLVTKGTLTGIIDRLEQKKLVRREVPEGNRRSFTIVLTEEGKRVFAELFPVHVEHLKERFNRLDKEELEQLKHLLRKLRSAFDDGESAGSV